jgi:hypothetical protein
VIGFGIHAALRNRVDSNPSALLQHVIAFDLGHDLVIAPLAVLLGWLVGRMVPRVARGPVRAGLAMTALLIIFSYPLMTRWGRRPTNSSTLPLDYGRNLTIVIVVVWLIAAAVIVRRVVAERVEPVGPEPSAPGGRDAAG